MTALYGLKFLAFVFIFFHHLAFPHSLGSVFTTFFFVFAGFITAYNFSKKNFEPNKENIKEFYINKVIKNYPVYILTLLISIPYVLLKSGFDLKIKDLFTHSFMLQTIIPQGEKTFMFNGLSWFLVDLMIFYLVIPFIYKFIKKFHVDTNKKYIFILGLLLLFEILLSMPFQNIQIISYSNTWWFLYISPFSRILNLLVGFIFGLLFEKNQELLKSKYSKTPKFVMFLIEFLAILTIIVRYKTSWVVPGSYSVSGAYDIPMSLILIFVFGLGSGFFSRILSIKPLEYLGKLSLSCYMLHQLFINYLTLCCFSSPWYNIAFSYQRNLFNGIFMLIVIICLSDCFQRYILGPMTDYLISFSKRESKKNKLITSLYKKISNAIGKISEFFIKNSSVFYFIVTLIFLIVMSFIIFSNLINPNILFSEFNNFFIILGIMCYFVIIFLLYKIVKKMKINVNKLFLICLMVYFILQIIVIIFLRVNPSWDFGIVLDLVSDNLNNGVGISSSIYLYQFQNNVLYAYLLNILLLPFKVFGITDYLIPAMIMNAIILDIGIIFIFKMIKLLFKEDKSKLFIILLFACQPILLYIPIVYTDTIAFTFIACILYFVLYFLKNKLKKKDDKTLLISIILGLLLGIGVQIKFTIIILFIAFVIILLFKENIMVSIKYLFFIVFSMMFVTFTIKIYVNYLFDDNTLNNNQVPFTHWIMMGLDNYGNYNTLDYQKTFESGDYKAKVEYNKKEIVERLKKHINNNDLISFYINKTAYLWNDGTYYSPELLSLAYNRNSLHEVYVYDGKYFTIYNYYSQIKHIFLLIVIMIVPFVARKDKKNELIRNFLLVSMIGYFCFFTLWEVSSRYLFHILPLLLVTSFYGLNIIIDKMNQVKFKRVK